jgi:hypothetical protein
MSSLGSNKLLLRSMLCIVWCCLCFWHCLKALRGHLNRHGKLVHIYVVNVFKQVVVGDGAMCPCMFCLTCALAQCGGTCSTCEVRFRAGYA